MMTSQQNYARNTTKQFANTYNMADHPKLKQLEMMQACGRLLVQLRAYAKGIALDIYACYLQKIATSLGQRVSPYHLAPRVSF